MAPSSPASTTSRVTTLMSIMPEPMVLATLVPSTNAATTMKPTGVASSALKAGSGVLDQDVGDGVRVVAAGVAGLFQRLVDLLPLQDVDGRPAAGLEEVGEHRVCLLYTSP